MADLRFRWWRKGLVDPRCLPEEITDSAEDVNFHLALLGGRRADIAKGLRKDGRGKEVEHKCHVRYGLRRVEHHEYEIGIHRAPEELDELGVVLTARGEVVENFKAPGSIAVFLELGQGNLFQVSSSLADWRIVEACLCIDFAAVLQYWEEEFDSAFIHNDAFESYDEADNIQYKGYRLVVLLL